MHSALMSYLLLCALVAFMGRRARIGAMRTFVVAVLLTPLVAFIYLLLFAVLDDQAGRGGESDRR